MGFVRYVGVEPNPKLAEITRKRAPLVEVYENELPRLPDELKRKFDLVLVAHVIEHASSGYEAHSWIAELLSCLKDGGFLAIVSPNAIDYKMSFWDIDWSHGFPTTINNLSQILEDNSCRLVLRRNMRLGYVNPVAGLAGQLLNVLLPTRLMNLVGQRLVGRELGTGLKSALLWGNVVVVATRRD